MPTTTRLDRSQRAHSQAALSTAFTPLAATSPSVAPPSQSSHQFVNSDASTRRQRSSSVSELNKEPTERSQGSQWPFNSTYSVRGFETDPFESLEGARRRQDEAAGGKRGGGGKRLQSKDGWWERLGITATSFGGWDDGEGRRWGATTTTRKGGSASGRRRSQRRAWVQDDESEEEEEEEEEEEGELTMRFDTVKAQRRGQEVVLERTRSSLAVFHDAHEVEEDPTADYDYFSTTKSSPSSAFSTPSLSVTHSRTSSISALSSSTISSPKLTRSQSQGRRIQPLSTTTTSRSTSPDTKVSPSTITNLRTIDADDELARMLSHEDRFGLFGLVEHVLEWPWTRTISPFSPPPTSNSPTPLRTTSDCAPISRIPSSHSLALGDKPLLDEASWTESGELSAYAKMRNDQLVGNESIRGVKWEDERRVGLTTTTTMESGGLREGLGALMEMVGLSGWMR